MRIKSTDFNKEIALLRKMDYNITTTTKKWKYIFVCPDNVVLYSDSFYTFEAMDEMPMKMYKQGRFQEAFMSQDGDIFIEKLELKMERPRIDEKKISQLSKAVDSQNGYILGEIIDYLLLRDCEVS